MTTEEKTKKRVSRKISEFREVFLDSESEYLEKLKKDPFFLLAIGELTRRDSKYLYASAQGLINKVECGMVREDQLEMVENKIIALLYAICDYSLEEDLDFITTKPKKKVLEKKNL